jgi:hypothetical protein
MLLMKVITKCVAVFSLLCLVGCWGDELDASPEGQRIDTLEYVDDTPIDSEDVIEAATEKVTGKVMEIITPEEHVKALKNKMKAAKKINDFDKREQNIMNVIHSAVLVEEYKLARNWVGGLKSTENRDAMLEMINESIDVVRDTSTSKDK